MAAAHSAPSAGVTQEVKGRVEAGAKAIRQHFLVPAEGLRLWAGQGRVPAKSRSSWFGEFLGNLWNQDIGGSA